MSLILYSLRRGGGTGHQKFCECFEVVVADEATDLRQQDVLNIQEPWRKVVSTDEDELVK